MKGIITADWHLRDDRPLARLDEDWYETQRKNIAYVVEKANEYETDIYIVGDLFDHPIVSPYLVNLLLIELQKLLGTFWVLPGNHDCQYRNIENINKTSLGVLLNSRSNQIQKIENEKEWPCFYYVFLHTLVFESEKQIPPNCEAKTANEIMKEYPDAKAIFTGDNHQAFQVFSDTQAVLNPGCLIRQSANEIDYTPGFFLFDIEGRGRPEFILSLDNEYDKFITDNHIVISKERDDRISAFVESLKNNKTITLSFEDNLKDYIIINSKKLSEGCKNIIEELLNEKK